MNLVKICCCCILFISCQSAKFTQTDIEHAQKLYGLSFEASKIDTLHSYLGRNLNGYDSLRAYDLPHQTFPALLFDPHPYGFQMPMIGDSAFFTPLPKLILPEDLNEVAFYSIPQLASLLRSGQLSSLRLTKLYLERLKKYDPILECAITITEDMAIAQAIRADEELAQGVDRGLLHGIPYGTKDLMSVKGYPTTWGAMPYKNQVIDHTATVIKKLEDAGAVLIAKLSSGALARGDVWFDGQTKNPWDVSQGASGSSAGSGSATSAGLVAFALGTETLGSITSPATRNGVSGLRPTYGRVSRDGVMSLSWSMDKVGPLARSAEDCAIVFEVIRGKDATDKTLIEEGFDFNPNLDIRSLKIGYLKNEIEADSSDSGDNLREVLKVLDDLGIERSPILLPKDYPYAGFDIILRSEAAAMFDDMVRTGKVDMMVQQTKRSRANSLRQARFIPAVEYLQANRFRNLLIEEIHELFKDYDVIIAPTFGGRQLLITNLTGHPVVTVPSGFDADGHPTSISFLGNLYEEGVIASFAHAFQKASNFHLQIPPDFKD